MHLVTFLHEGRATVGIADQALTQVSPLPLDVAPSHDHANCKLPIAGRARYLQVARPSLSQALSFLRQSRARHATCFALARTTMSTRRNSRAAVSTRQRKSCRSASHFHEAVEHGDRFRQVDSELFDPTDSTDYEGELTVVIGRGGRGIKKQDALAHVFATRSSMTSRHARCSTSIVSGSSARASTVSARWVRRS